MSQVISLKSNIILFFLRHVIYIFTHCLARTTWGSTWVWATEIIRNCLPPFFSILSTDIFFLCLFKLSIWLANSIDGNGCFSIVRLSKLFIHVRKSFVVFLETSHLPLQKHRLLWAGTIRAFEWLYVSLKVFVFSQQFLVEPLLHFNIPPHILHFSVPKIQLIPLHRVCLLSCF